MRFLRPPVSDSVPSPQRRRRRMRSFTAAPPVILLLVGLSGCILWKELTPGPSADAIAAKCEHARRTGNYEEAEDLLESACRRHPDNPDYHLLRIELALARGDDRAAVQRYRTLLEHAPHDAESWRKLGELLVRLGRMAEATEALRESLRYNPHDREAMLMLAARQEADGKTADALETYHWLLNSDPANSTARVKLALLHLKGQREDRAAPLLREVCLDCTADTAELDRAWWLLGLTYGRQGRWTEATDAIAKAIEYTAEPTTDQRYRLAYAAYRADRVTEALQLAHGILLKEPDHAEAMSLVLATTGGNRSHPQFPWEPVDIASGIAVPPGWKPGRTDIPNQFNPETQIARPPNEPSRF